MENTTLLRFLANASHSENTNQYDGRYSATGNNGYGSSQKSNIYKVISLMVVYLAFCVLGIIGNGLVIWFGIFRMKKTVNVVWYLSLAVADFFFSLFSPLNYTQVVFGYQGFQNMCKLIHFLLYNNLGIGLLQIIVISVDRCVCVLFPVWCHNHRRPRLAFVIVLIIWIISFSGSMIAIMYSTIANVNDRMTCTAISDTSRRKRKVILEFVFAFLLPFIIIVSCYIVIVLYVRRKRIITSSRPLKTSAAVITVFFVCWLPIHLYYLIAAFQEVSLESYVRYYSYLSAMILIILNSCINPVLYAFIGRDFKEKLCGSFQDKLEKAFIEEDKAFNETQNRCTARAGPRHCAAWVQE